MSRMRDIIIEVQDLLEQSVLSYDEIAKVTGAPISWVKEMDRVMLMEMLFSDDNTQPN